MDGPDTAAPTDMSRLTVGKHADFAELDGT